MIVVRDFAGLKKALPNKPSEVIGKLTISRKPLNSLHAGHENIVNTLITNSTVSLVNIWSWEAIYSACFPYDPMIINDPTWDGETYMISWLENLGVDIVFIPEWNYHETAFVTANLPNLLPAGDALISAEGYSLKKCTEMQWNILRMTIAAEEVSKVQQFYRKDYIINTYKDGFITFIFKHYMEKYHGITYDILAPVKRPDGLPHSTYLLNARQVFIDYAVSVNDVLTTNINDIVDCDMDHIQNDDMPVIFQSISNPNGFSFYINVHQHDEILGVGKKFIECWVYGINANNDRPIILTYYI